MPLLVADSVVTCEGNFLEKAKKIYQMPKLCLNFKVKIKLLL